MSIFEEEIDLFEHYEDLPQEVQDVIDDHFVNGDASYEECQKLVDALKPLGYTCEYGLDGYPYDLRKINLEESN